MSASIAVAHVLSSFGIGGQERVALDLAATQRSAGCRVLAISLAPGPEGPLAADFRERGAAVETVAKGDRFDTTLPLRLAALFVREAVELVHTHNPQALIYGALAGRLARCAVVHTKHGANPDRARRLWMRRAAAALADAYVAVSETTAEAARKHRDCAPGKLRVIPNGIDLRAFRPDPAARATVRAELGIPEGAWVVGTAARLAPEKGQTLLVRAMLPLLGEGLRLVIAGDGPEAGALRALAESSPNGRFVHLLGLRRDVPRLLAAFDVFALSSITEGLPLAVPEAMAAGLAVVSTAVGGIPDVIENEVTGFLVPPGDEAALRERMAALAANRPIALACGLRARETALARYGADRMARDYLTLYGEVLARRRGPAALAAPGRDRAGLGLGKPTAPFDR